MSGRESYSTISEPVLQRPESVKMDARDINGARFTVNLQDILFFDRMTEGVLESISEQLQALEKKYEDKNRTSKS
ncbi:hypothetical protein M0R45_016993 [Rubus argutus]|uniref:Uncharacterized protein n=1 Tax=Rubus argutus TaxID=59490 RepID=A0AAW1XU97_RUBAR